LGRRTQPAGPEIHRYLPDERPRRSKPVPDFPLIDAHVHLYDPAAIDYPWMRDAPVLNSLHGPAEFTRAIGDVQVDGLIFVEVDAALGQELAEARWVERAAKADSRIRAMVASLPLEKGRANAADIAELATMPHARAVRRLIQGHAGEPGWCLRPDFVEGVKAVGRAGLSFELCIFHSQMADAIELVRRCPEVTFMLDHIGKPGIKDGIREPWWSEIATMASLPNVTCKISGAITEADHAAWSYDQVAPYVARAIEAFGFDRVVFGGDWPVLELAAHYPEWVAMVDRITAGASQADLRKLYRDNAIRHYRL
jgi:L-fuconolactonase